MITDPRALIFLAIFSCTSHGSIPDAAETWGRNHSPAPLIHVTCRTPNQVSSPCTVYYQYADPIEIICTRLRCKEVRHVGRP